MASAPRAGMNLAHDDGRFLGGCVIGARGTRIVCVGYCIVVENFAASAALHGAIAIRAAASRCAHLIFVGVTAVSTIAARSVAAFAFAVVTATIAIVVIVAISTVVTCATARVGALAVAAARPLVQSWSSVATVVNAIAIDTRIEIFIGNMLVAFFDRITMHCITGLIGARAISAIRSARTLVLITPTIALFFLRTVLR